MWLNWLQRCHLKRGCCRSFCSITFLTKLLPLAIWRPKCAANSRSCWNVRKYHVKKERAHALASILVSCSSPSCKIVLTSCTITFRSSGLPLNWNLWKYSRVKKSTYLCPSGTFIPSNNTLKCPGEVNLFWSFSLLVSLFFSFSLFSSILFFPSSLFFVFFALLDVLCKC